MRRPKPLGVVAAGVALMMGTNGVAETKPRILSLDQCADQYVLALVPDAELALSSRADDADSWMRRQAIGHVRLRPTLEAAVAFRPDIVVRYWGGEPALLRVLESHHARVVTIEDTQDMAGIRRNIRSVAASLGQVGRGQAVIDRMDRNLSDLEVRPKPALRPSVLYMTSGGFTSGSGTLIDAILGAAGFRNAAAHPGFGPVSVERVVLDPPLRFVLGFFEQRRADWRGVGRHPVLAGVSKGRVVASLPSAALTCPAWFASDAAVMIVQGQGRGRSAR